MTLWPQYTILALTGLGFGYNLARYGEPKKPDKYDMSDLLIAPGISLWILYMGGFFSGLM
jgi:hypothetical protein